MPPLHPVIKTLNIIKLNDYYIYVLYAEYCRNYSCQHISTRVPGKNFRLMNGKPLYWYIVNTLLNVKCISKIIIDTNSPIIFESVPCLFKSHMSRILLYRRPDHLCSGDTPTNDLLMNIMNNVSVDADYYLQTHATNPLLKPDTIVDAINCFQKIKINMIHCFQLKHIIRDFMIKMGKI